MDFGDLLAGLALAICGLGLGFAVFRHFVGEDPLALTLAAVIGLVIGAGYLLWHRRSFLLRKTGQH
jgi:hypothetical protein